MLEYITSQIDAGRKQKEEDLLEAVCHEIFSVSTAFFVDVFQVVCATSKNARHKHGLKVDVVRGMVNALCSQLMYMKRKPVDGGWEQHLGYDPVFSPIQGARAHFLTPLILDLQERFVGGVWVQQKGLPDWIEASSCSCERVFSFVTSHGHNQSMQRMCEVLWIRCNGPCGVVC